MSESEESRLELGLDHETEPRRAGLCADCAHARRIESDRGSVFYLCDLSASDSAYPKYPRLPVMRCSGYIVQTK